MFIHRNINITYRFIMYNLIYQIRSHLVQRSTTIHVGYIDSLNVIMQIERRNMKTSKNYCYWT